MNQRIDHGAGRPRVTLRLDRDLIDKFDDLALVEGVHRTKLVRRLLVDALIHRRIEGAVREYAGGRRTAWSASEVAGGGPV